MVSRADAFSFNAKAFANIVAHHGLMHFHKANALVPRPVGAGRKLKTSILKREEKSMNRKKALAVLLAVSTGISTLPSLAFASDTAAKTWKDGTYAQTVTVMPDGGEDFDAYDLKVNVTVEGGKVTDVSLDDSNDYDSVKKNKKKSLEAINGVRSAVIEANGTDGVDAVSGATCTSRAILEAVDQSLTEDNTSTPTDPSENPDEEKDVYVRVNVPFAVFYKGLVNDTSDSELDAVSTATAKGKAAKYVDADTFYGPNANEIDGVTVPVKMSSKTYAAVKDLVSDAAASYHVGEEVTDPSVYMEMSYSDGEYSFSWPELDGTDEGSLAVSTMKNTWDKKRRDVQVILGGEDETFVDANDFYGGYVKTTDGTAYPLLPMESIYSAGKNNEIGFAWEKTAQTKTAADGTVTTTMNLNPKIYWDMEGKTLDTITIYTTSGIKTYNLTYDGTEDAGEQDGKFTMRKAEEAAPQYVLMNIPYDEFYVAEGDDDVDAVSSATKSKPRSTLVRGSYHVNNDGSDITGVSFPVKVTDPSVLKNLKHVTDADSYDITLTMRGKETTTTYAGKDALFENAGTYAYYSLAEEPSVYKELTVGSDGKFSFSQVKGKTTETSVDAELASGAETNYGDYQIDIAGFKQPDTVYGVTVQTTDGSTYGLRHLENIWRAGEIAFSTGHTLQSHGSPLAYANYKDMEGKTVDAVTYYTEEGLQKLNLNTPLFLKPVSDAKLTAETVTSTKLKVDGIPADATNVKVSITSGSGHNVKTLAENLDINDGTVTLPNGVEFEDGTNYTITVSSDQYAGMSASATYTAPKPTETPTPEPTETPKPTETPTPEPTETPKPADSQMPFKDVASTAYYADAVQWAYDNKITSGISATEFGPGRTVTRAQIVSFLYRKAGSPAVDSSVTVPFTDVSGKYYTDAVRWAYAKGITAGTSGTTFSPNDPCTRAQIVTLLWRMKGSADLPYSSKFTDVKTGAYYAKAVAWAADKGVAAGVSDTLFAPGSSCTRADAVTFLYRSR